MKLRLIFLGFMAFSQGLSAQWIRKQATGNNMVQDWRFASVSNKPFVKGNSIYIGTRVSYAHYSINNYRDFFIQKIDAKTGVYSGFISVPPSNSMRSSTYRENSMETTYYGLFKSTVRGTGAFLEPNYLREMYDWESGALLWSKTSSFHPLGNSNSCDTSRLIAGLTDDTSLAVINAINGEILHKTRIDSLVSRLNILSGLNLSNGFPDNTSYGYGDTLYLTFNEPISLTSKFLNVKLNKKDLSILDFSIWDYRPWVVPTCNYIFYLRNGGQSSITGSLQDSVRKIIWPKISFEGDTLASFDINGDYFGKLAERPIWSWGITPHLDSRHLIIATEANSLVNYNTIGTDVQIFDVNDGRLKFRGKIIPNWGNFSINQIFNSNERISFIYTTMGSGLSPMTDWRIGRLDSTLQVNDPQFYTLSSDSPMIDNYISVYPNPVENAFQFAGVFPIANYEMTLYNSAGEQVMSESFHTRNTVLFPAQTLVTGIYFWRITQEDGRLFASGRLCKQ